MIKKESSFEAKVRWLRLIFSNDLTMRRRAMDDVKYDSIVFESEKEFSRALEELQREAR